MRPLHIIILSSKSSGSTAVMNYFNVNYSFQSVHFTRHHEKETLYWLKAAALLGLPQDKLYRSGASFTKETVTRQLKEFMQLNNVVVDTVSSKEGIFHAYRKLIDRFSPWFIEKSPHHLFNRSNLELLIEFMEANKEGVDFLVIGLVRHPHDVIYSAWNRWKFDCKEFEEEWRRSYENLLWFKERYPSMKVLRYEDIARDNSLLGNLMNMEMASSNYVINARSLLKWKTDLPYAHQLSTKTIALAKRFGYQDFQSSSNARWTAIQFYHRWRWRLSRIKKKVISK